MIILALPHSGLITRIGKNIVAPELVGLPVPLRSATQHSQATQRHIANTPIQLAMVDW